MRSYAAGLGADISPTSEVRWVSAPSGARLAFVDGAVAKFHHGRTDAAALEHRLRAVASPNLEPLFVPPLTTTVRSAPDGHLVTAWPKLPTLDLNDVIPWAEAGHLLARLHRAAPPVELPRHAATARLSRALDRARSIPDGSDRDLLLGLGDRFVREEREVTDRRERAQRHTDESAAPQANSTVHGDFHLGQLGFWEGSWRLIDIDDVGLGDPAWDLARPAGFWAAGLLADECWMTFLDAYRAGGGPAVPATGDPWPPLDLPARCAVVVGAVRILSRPVHSDITADALLQACRQM